MFVTIKDRRIFSSYAVLLYELKVNSRKKSLTRVLNGCFIRNVYPLYRKRVSYKNPFRSYIFLSSLYFFLLLRFTFTVVLEPVSNSLNPKTERVSLRARRARGEPYAKAVFSITTITVNATLNYKKKSKKQRHIVSRRKSNECKKGYECLYV